MNKYICIDVGGTSIKHSIINENKEIIESSQIPTNAHLGGDVIINNIKNIVSTYLKQNNNTVFLGIAISTTGMVDPNRGSIIHTSPLTPGYMGCEIKKEIETSFNIPCEAENDVNCAGLGEMWTGAGKGYKNIICITVGTGIGACLIIDNKLVNGVTNSAGEIGYIKINNKDLQDISATSVLVKNIQNLKNDNTIDGKEVFDMAKKGDKECINEIYKMIENLCIGISNILYIINPEILIIGGAITKQKEYLMPIIIENLNKYVHKHIIDKTKIEFAQNENNAGMIGALYNLLHK